MIQFQPEYTRGEIIALLAMLIISASIGFYFAPGEPNQDIRLSKAEREQILLQECFPGGWFDSHSRRCQKFKDAIMEQADKEGAK